MHWLTHWSGEDGGSVYNLLSGILPDLGFLAGAYAILRRHNCHQPRCWRISRHVISGGQGITYGACRKHRIHVANNQAGKTIR